MEPVCCECKVSMQCSRNGFRVERGGVLWSGDRWTCPGCGWSIVTGFGLTPEAEDWQEQFETCRSAAEESGCFIVVEA